MTTEDKNTTAPEGTDAVEVAQTNVDLQYAGASQVVAQGGEATVALFGDVHRAPVAGVGVLRDPLRVREALSALYAIVGSDFRYKPKDRTAYVAYLRLKQQAATQTVWQAQQAYFQWVVRNDPAAWILLDPIITVHPDQVIFEVFSKDEGTYAKLGLHNEAFEFEGDRRYGTTNIDFSNALFEGVQQMRSYRRTRLSIGQKAVAVQTEAAGEVLEKKIQLPDAWLRGFLQVQSSAMLPTDHFELAPMDLYNTLRHLRLHADQKGKPRGLRVELVPGESPRLVLEPWEEVISSSGAAYKGKQAKVVRVWGRRRLGLVRRLLPFVDKVDVYVVGSGLPSFWVFRGQGFDLTLGLTGFTSSNWSQALTFDLLLPRSSATSDDLEKVVGYLAEHWVAPGAAIGKATGLSGAALTAALQLGCQHGRLMVDVAHDVYRLRPVIDVPIDQTRLEFRTGRERVAWDLVARKGAVKVESENRIHGTGLEITGRVDVTEDKREYRPQVLIDDEALVKKAECTCTFFRKNGLKQGPCPHLVALMILYRRQEAEKHSGKKARKTVTLETRTYSRRKGDGEHIYQVTLNRARVKVRWGLRGQDMRVQNMVFNTVDDARDAYYARVDDLERKGYLDATTG